MTNRTHQRKHIFMLSSYMLIKVTSIMLHHSRLHTATTSHSELWLLDYHLFLSELNPSDSVQNNTSPHKPFLLCFASICFFSISRRNFKKIQRKQLLDHSPTFQKTGLHPPFPCYRYHLEEFQYTQQKSKIPLKLPIKKQDTTSL